MHNFENMIINRFLVLLGFSKIKTGYAEDGEGGYVHGNR